MSFRYIGAITKESEVGSRWRKRRQLEEDEDIKSKSKTTQAIKLFSELKTPVEVAIALDLPTDQVQAIYQEYWELDGMYRLAQIYEETKYDLHDILVLHKIVKELGMEKQDIKKVLELAKCDQLQYLQPKVEYLRNEISMLERERMRYTTQLSRLNRMIDGYEETLAQKRRNGISECYNKCLIDYDTYNLHRIVRSGNSNSISESIRIDSNTKVIIGPKFREFHYFGLECILPIRNAVYSL